MKKPHNSAHGIVVIAASRGGVQAIGRVLSVLPARFPLPIAVVLHRGTRGPYFLADVLRPKTVLAVKFASNGELLEGGIVYLAVPQFHLTVSESRTLLFMDGRRIRHLICAADPLFTSAAEAFGKSVIAVVLTGGGHDASDGVREVKKGGGIVIAQDRATSEDFAMPESAIQTGCVDLILPISAIGPKLLELANDLAVKSNDSDRRAVPA